MLVTLALWLNYRNSRRTYLALASVAGVLEICRHIIDMLIVQRPEIIILYHLSGILQILSSLTFLCALLRIRAHANRFNWLIAVPALMFVSISGTQQLGGFNSSVSEWYLYYLPLLLTQALIIWSAQNTSHNWPVSKVFLLTTSVGLLMVRGWLPSHMAYDLLYNTVYYLETLIYAMMLAALILFAMEDTYEALQRSEEHYRLLIEQMPDPTFVSRVDDFQFVEVNKRACENYGFSREEFLQMQIFDIEVFAPLKEDVRQLYDETRVGEVIEVEGINKRKDGSTFPVHVRFCLLDDTYAVANVRDITLQKKAGEELEQRVEERTHALKESEARYKDLIDRSPDVVWRMNPDGVFTFISQAIKSISGFDPEEMVGLSFEEFRKKFVSDASRDDAREALERRRGGGFGNTEFVYELTCNRKDGGHYVAEFRSVPVLNEDGKIVEIHGITRDISDRKMLEEQLRQSQKFEAVGQLAGGIAHDFNNLLTAINGYSELLLGKLKPDDPLHHGLSEIGKAGEYAAALTRQLLALGSKQVLQPKVINLGAIVVGMQDILQRLIGEHIELHIRCDPDLQKVKADPGQMEQVIMNLVINARDAMARGGNITVNLENVVLDDQASATLVDLQAGDFIMLSVSDTGIGMNEETLSHIFEPFYTTKGADKGTGLGLSTVFGIVKQSGGEIQAASEPGKGSTFRIYLPRVEASELLAEETERPSSPIDGDETILLVEDEDIIRELLKHILEKLGYTVLLASNGEEALLTAQRYEGPINLMITDIVMPHMSGHELVERLSPLRHEMSVLYISGYDEKMVADQGLVDIGKRFLQKPFGPKAVGKKIREILDKPATAN
ncbi:MAG: PAS domain S-box protein [Gammaproteobacteria bacterium]|nr:PAS domain S-box protein [Gammaproteobacteria bacterium]